MKLIQQLERKLSWRSSQRSTPGLAEAKARQRKENGKKQRQQQQLMAAKTAAAVRVSDAEFSPYISFGCRLKTVPLNSDYDSSPASYEVVAIRTRAPFQTIVAQQSSLYSSPHHHPRSPSPRSEGHRPESAGSSGDHHHHHHQLQQQQQPKTVEHIYDQIDCHHRRSSSLSPTTTTTHYQNHDHHHQWSPSSEGKQNHFGSQSPTEASSGSNESSGSGSGSSHCGPITVTGGSSRRRRNRIKTNPWFAGSPWAAPATKSSKENHQQQQQDKENIYESIENLLLNNRRKQQPPINQSYTRPFAQPSPPQNSSATYLRRPARPTSLAVQKRKHLMETYPTSPMFLSSNQTVNPVEESPADHLLFTSPSVEFLNQSQQLCRQISSYFEDMSSRASPPPPPREEMNSSSSTTTRPSLERKVDTLHQQSSLLLSNNTSDSMETIDLSPVNPFNHHHQPALSEWSLAAEDDDNDDDDNDNGHHRNDHHQLDSTTTVPTISSPAPPPPPPSTKSPSPPARNKRKLQSPTSRPESLYSNPPSNSPRRQSAKVDRLKCQLKEVVHAAIQQAKTKKNRKEV